VAKAFFIFIVVLFTVGCATHARQSLMHIGVVDVQSSYYYSEQHEQNLGSLKKQDVLQEAYGYALSRRVEEILANIQVSDGFICHFSVALIPGGQVVRTNLLSCHFDGETQNKINEALMRERLPYRGYESVFRRVHFLEACAPKKFCSH